MEIPDEYKGLIETPEEGVEFGEKILEYMKKTFSSSANRQYYGKQAKMFLEKGKHDFVDYGYSKNKVEYDQTNLRYYVISHKYGKEEIEFYQEKQVTPYKYRKCRMTLSTFLYWSAFYHDSVLDDIKIRAEYFNIELSNEGLVIYPSIPLGEFNYKVFRCINKCYILEITDFEPYKDWDYCEEQSDILLRENTTLRSVFLTSDDFDQTEILDYLYDVTVNNIDIDSGKVITSVVSSLKLSESRPQNREIGEYMVNLSVDFQDMDIVEYFTPKFLQYLNSLKDKIEGNMHNNIIETREYGAVVNKVNNITWQFGNSNIKILISFGPIFAYPIDIFYESKMIGAELAKLNSLCSKHSTYGDDQFYEMASVYGVKKTWKKSRVEICDEIRERILNRF